MTAPIVFVCARCGWHCQSFAVFVEHIYLCCGLPPAAAAATVGVESAEPPEWLEDEPPVWLEEQLPPIVTPEPQPELVEAVVTEMVRRTRKPRASKKPKPPARPTGEIELVPTETAPDGEGNAQSAGVRPSTPFARAVDRNRAGDGWKRRSPARPTRYCRCGIALPSWLADKCENCGRAVAQ